MSFKKIEINGFKSFADRIEIKFTNGVTGIVGPNGCGKSNVADAIRFCLGEGSSKSLRGGKMNDVIFAGTEKRKSLSYCEVSLFFDNRQRIFKDLNFDEVVFTRKLFRDNESEYYINKTLCRKLDILDALRDSGVGKEGYSIIGQGKVEELISSKPVDRRSIFDEAAGISKFKHTKEDSQRKLARAKDSLDRINDLLTFTEAQLKPLIADAEKARKYKEIYEKLKHYEVNIYLHQYETTNETKAVIEAKKAEIVAKINTAQEKLEAAKAGYDKAMEEFSTIDETIQSLNGKLLAASVSREKNEGEIAGKRQSIEYVTKQIASYTASIKDSEVKLKEAENALRTIQDKAKELSYGLSGKRNELSGKENELDKIMDEIASLEGAERESRTRVEEAMRKLADIKGNMSTLIADRRNYTEQIEASRTRISDDLIRLADAKNSYEEKSKKHTEILASIEEAQAKSESLEKELAEKQAKSSEIAIKLKSVNENLQTTKAYVEFYTKMFAANNEFDGSVAKLLNEKEKNPEIASRMENVVVRLLAVPEKYEVAVETALGSAVQNIVTPTSDDATYLIDFLKRNKYGRATFLPMSDIKPRQYNGDFGAVSRLKGCYGMASDLVRYDSKYANIVSNLLGGTLICDDIHIGLEIARQTRYSYKIVTLDGDIIHQRGSMTGGSRTSAKSSFFSNEREFKENKAKLVKLEEEKNKLDNEKKSLDTNINTLNSDFIKNGKLLQNLKVNEASLNLQVQRFKNDMDSAESQIAFEEAEIEDKTAKVNEITNNLNSVEALEKTISGANENASEMSSENEAKLNSLKEKREAVSQEIMDLRVTETNYETSISHLNDDFGRTGDTIAALKQRINSDKSNLAINKTDLENLNNDLQSLMFENSASGTDQAALSSMREQIISFNSYKKELSEKINEFNEERNEATGELNELGEKKTQQELMLQRVDTDLETMTDRVTVEYNLDYESCKEFRDSEFNAEEWIPEASKMRRQIERLGEVHLDAIERLETTNKDYVQLQTQRDDVIKAIKGEEKIIDNLSREMKVIFDDQFAKINANFKKTFRELFNGGNCDLIIQPLEEGQTDELDAGIEIVAQPPSKALQRLSLLSGGEKALTAIAILFAILQLRPMPFCVLDEIEAALDDANALRFAKYLKRFSQSTQFIVITHRKPTMELCDSLYGVTMEEKGVTKLVSVSLSDAARFGE